MKNFRIFFYSFLIILLLSAFYFRFNAGTIYAKAGDFYYKKNNIQQALNYYEKAFYKGYNDSSKREIYVNLIINSPLSLESQEKLVKIAEDEVNDSASQKAKYFLYDLKREIHRKYPLNYIKQAPFNQKIVRWNRLPITYSYSNKQAAPPEFVKEIDNAFTEWEKASSHAVLFSCIENSDNADILIDFVQNKAEDIEYGKKYIVAYTTPILNLNTLEHMNIKFYLQNPDGTAFSPIQIYNTALHEIFHALGFMGHSFDSNNIMYLAKDNNVLINNLRAELTEADVTTLKLLYKIKPDITNTDELKSEYIPYLVLGDDNEVNSSKAREAKNYIRQAPTLPIGYIDLAESYASQKKYPEAIRSLEKALALADTDDIKYIVYYNLAVSYFYINHIEMALDYTNKAMEFQNTEELHFLLAEIYTKQGDENQVIKEYQYLISKVPNNIDYVVNLANIYLKKHKYLEARRVLKNYIKKNPKERNNKRIAGYGILLF